MEDNQNTLSKIDNDEKLAYISEEIMNKQYNPEHFKLFFQKKTGDEEIMLERYTLEQIKKFVNEFQKQEKTIKNDNETDNPQANGSENANNLSNEDGDNSLPKEPEQEKQKEHEQEQEDEREQEQDQSANNLPQTIDNTLLDIDEDDDNNYISTLKQTKGILSDYHNLTIMISNPIKTSSFMFFSAEYQFTLEVAELSSKVIRTMDDFTFLKETLEMYYPTTYIPPLPTFTILTSSSNDEYLKRKANYLIMFLNSLTQNPLIMSTQLFLDFLQLTKENFLKVKNSYDEIDPPLTFKKFHTMEGLLNVSVIPKMETEPDKIKENINTKNKEYKKLNEAIKELLYEFSVISDKMKKVSSAFGDIAKEHTDMPLVEKIYLNFEELTKRYSNSYLNQQLVFKEDIQQYIKFTIKNFNAFIEVINDSNKAKKDFEAMNVLPEQKALLNKRELRKLDHLKKTYGYYLNKVFNEHCYLNKNTEESFKCHLQDINSKRERLFGDYLSMSALLQIKIGA